MSKIYKYYIILVIFLLLCALNSKAKAEINFNLQKEVIYIEKNIKTPFSGYLFTEKKANNLLKNWQEAETEKDIWRQSFYELNDEINKSSNIQKNNLLAINKKNKKQKINLTIFSIIFGGILGAVIQNNS